MPATLVDYKGLQVLTPDPVGEGGLAINDNFKAIADGRLSVPNLRRVTYLAPGERYDPYPTSAYVTSLIGVGDIASRIGSSISSSSPTADEPISVSYGTSATNNNYCGTDGTLAYRVGRNLRYQAYAQVPTTTNVRVWLGLTSGLASAMNSGDNPGGPYAAFRYSTFAGDTTWKCVTKDTSTQKVSPSGIAIGTTGAKFEIEFDDAASKVIFKINGAIVATHTHDGIINDPLPATGTNLRFCMCATTLTNAVRNLRIGWIYIDSDK